jgi:DNA polymerase III delta prime subunit
MLKEKLDYFLKIDKIPNIIFHGPSGCGKRTIVNDFLLNIYGRDKIKLKANVMMVNCSHGKGIKFIREELKFFAKTNIQSNKNVLFKSIVLLNADSLTIDAQSALRRCIEVFCHNTRFFIIVDNKHKLLYPILSRFCEIYVPEEYKDGKLINLHKKEIEKHYDNNKIEIEILKMAVNKFQEEKCYDLPNLIKFSNSLYEKGFAVKSIMDNINELDIEIKSDKTLLILCYHKLKVDFRCEKMLFFFMLKMLFLSSNDDIKNMLLK